MRQVHLKAVTFFLVLTILAVGNLVAAPVLLQKATCSTTGTTANCVFPGAITASSVIVVCSSSRGGGALSGITQTNLTWSAANNRIFNISGTNNRKLDMWYNLNAPANADPNLGITWAASGRTVAAVLEYGGLRTVNVLDADTASNNTGTNTNPVNSGTINSANLDQAANLLLACLGRTDNGEAASLSFTNQSNSYVEEIDANSISASTGVAMAVEDKIITVAENAVVDANASTAGYWIGGIIALKTLPTTFNLTTHTNGGAGKGYILSSPAGVTCGTTCVFGFDQNASVTITAYPAPDATFVSWSGDCSGSSASYNLTMSAAKDCTANFSLKTRRTLTVTKAGTGGGLVRSSGREIDGATLSHTYVDGQIDYLQAYPDAGSVFAGWSGDAGCGATVTMTANLNCTATFNLQSGAAKLYYVMDDGAANVGDDALCNGLSNCSVGNPAPCGGGANCAYKTIGKAVSVMSCANGDDIKVVTAAHTFNESIAMPAVCQCPSTSDPCVLQATATTVLHPGAVATAIDLSTATGANRAKNIEIRDWILDSGTNSAIRCGPGKDCGGLRIVDVTAGDVSQLTTKPNGFFYFDGTCGWSSHQDNLIDGFLFDGDETACGSYSGGTGGNRVCGTLTATALYAGGSCGTEMRNSRVQDSRGSISRLADYGVLQDNAFKNIACLQISQDDACFQNYNTNNVIYRRNLIINVAPADNNAYAVIKARRTCQGGVPGVGPCSATGGQPSGFDAYNNTIWSYSGVCAGNTDLCTSNTWGSTLTRSALVSYADGSTITGTAQDGGTANTIVLAAGSSATNNLYNSRFLRITAGSGNGERIQISSYDGTTKIATMVSNWVSVPDHTSNYTMEAYAQYAPWDSVRNIIANYIKNGASGSNILFAASDVNDTKLCPSALTWSGDIFFNNDAPNTATSCTVTAEGDDVLPGTARDPNIDVSATPQSNSTFAPGIWSPACFALGSGHTAVDGDVADNIVGAVWGLCLSDSACADGVKNVNETDTDCGGGACPTCANTKTCLQNSDCTSGNCSAGTCQPAAGGTRKNVTVTITELQPDPSLIEPYFVCLAGPFGPLEIPDPPPGYASWRPIP